jgi:hypothetical protein
MVDQSINFGWFAHLHKAVGTQPYSFPPLCSAETRRASLPTYEEQAGVLGQRRNDLPRAQSNTSQRHEWFAPEAVREAAGAVDEQERHGLVLWERARARVCVRVRKGWRGYASIRKGQIGSSSHHLPPTSARPIIRSTTTHETEKGENRPTTSIHPSIHPRHTDQTKTKRPNIVLEVRTYHSCYVSIEGGTLGRHLGVTVVDKHVDDLWRSCCGGGGLSSSRAKGQSINRSTNQPNIQSDRSTRSVDPID